MTQKQLNRGIYLNDQEKCIDRLFTMMQEEADFHCILGDEYRIVLAAAFAEAKRAVRQEFRKL